MKTSQFLIALLSTLLTFTAAANAASNPNYSKGDLIHSGQPYARVGGNRVIFGYKQTGCDVNALNQAAINLKNRSTTDRWDDQWYAFSVQSGTCLMVGWYDLDTRKYGYGAVQNQPNTWAVRSNSAGWANMTNGQQKKYTFTINGQKFDIDLFNPFNQGALGGDDILISFGY